MRAFAQAQRLGRALMLPIAVLPVAGLLLRLGQPDLLDTKLVSDAGDAIFANLGLLFAIGVAVAFAHESHGVAGLAGAVGYFVMTATLKAMDAAINMGVLSGIISGVVAGAIYNRTRDIELPAYLSFFGGKRFAAIATGFASLGLGLLFGVAWPPVQAGIDSLGGWLIGTGAIGLFVYGVLNRLLLVTGLHHILNNLVWFVFGSYVTAEGVVHGDLNRFFAGDPTAGYFMAGFFPILMFGLPAATLAMVRAARPENKKTAGGVLVSSGLTSALTGVTEPIEYSFMFHAPVLYVVHALLTGASMALMYLLGVRLGFSFSAGAIDYALSATLGANAWLVFPVGAVTFVVYYFLFSVSILRFDLKTPGREVAEISAVVDAAPEERGAAFLRALGGAENLVSVEACTTRLRLAVRSGDRIDEAALRALGAKGVVRPAEGSVQVVIGPEAEIVAERIKRVMKDGGTSGTGDQNRRQATGDGEAVDAAPWMEAMGGKENVKGAEVVAGTRVRVVVKDVKKIDRGALEKVGAQGVMVVSGDVVHVIAGERASAVADALAR